MNLRQSCWASVVLLTAIQSACGFYNPNLGQWISRDPASEAGGLNLNCFVNNNAILAVDPHGQHPVIIVIGLIILAGCGAQDCVCEGQKVSKTPIDTGVVTHKWTGTAGATGTPVHWWLTWAGGSADANSYALVIQPGDGIVKSPAGATPSPSDSERLKLSPCEYDFTKLHVCLTRVAGDLAAKGQYFGMCWDLPPYLIDQCKRESAGCTVPQ